MCGVSKRVCCKISLLIHCLANEKITLEMENGSQCILGIGDN